jgi:ribonucleotide monophosphatase NagD (HAD superfamily)
MVGDMLEYDIKGAQDFGIDSLLVLSGLDGMPHRLPELAEDMLRRQIFPTWVLRSIA